MKRLLTWILAALLAAAVGIFGYVAYVYVTTDEGVVPRPAVMVMDNRLEPYGADWRVPILNGALFKDVSWTYDSSGYELGVLGTAPLELALSLPEGFENTAEIRLAGGADGAAGAAGAADAGGAGADGAGADGADGAGAGDGAADGAGADADGEGGADAGAGAVLYSDIAAAGGAVLPEGSYVIEIRCTLPESPDRGYGTIKYSCSFSVDRAPEPELALGRQELLQGEILPLKLANVPPGITPEADTELGMAVFMPDGEGAWFAAVPIGNAQPPGSYSLKIRAGEWEAEAEIAVGAYAFPKQNLIIDTSDPVISEANSPAAYQEYREKIPPLFNTFDSERYWHGVFEVPAKGRVSTEFGTIRYTNGDYSNSRSHNGMDIAAPTGTPVYAPNAGRAVLAERLLNTGNTLVIEHGGGLKTYYFHMSRIDVAPGDMIAKGDKVGEVGSTGYSTGAHLHYEMRIGDKPVSPSMLFDEAAALYSLEQP